MNIFFQGISPNTLREIKSLQHSDCEYVRKDSFSFISRCCYHLFRSFHCLTCILTFPAWHLFSITCLTLFIRGLKTKKIHCLDSRSNPIHKCFYEDFLIFTTIWKSCTGLRRAKIKNYELWPYSMMFFQDIKPANLLINEHDVLKIADFGLARLYNSEETRKCYSPQVATRWYRAPEILWGTQIYGPSIDMWAVGCVFAEMLRGVPLFAVRKL